MNDLYWRAATPWQGRVDLEPGAKLEASLGRWHQAIAPWPEAEAAVPTSQGQGIALIGYAVDEGVRRNQGRIGAAQGPAAVRTVLANLPRHDTVPRWDLGDVVCPDGNLAAAQTKLASLVQRARAHQCLPIVVGGGHDVAWGSFQGISSELGGSIRNLLIVNLDAHFDLRLASEPNSGTPFQQIHAWCTEHGHPFNYLVFGISRYANTDTLFQRAQATGTRYCLDDELQTPEQTQDAQTALAQALADCDAVYLTVCLDVLPAAVAPGVSAPSAFGVPQAHIERLIDQIVASGKLCLAEIAELNPNYDIDQRTARVAARLVGRMVVLGR